MVLNIWTILLFIIVMFSIAGMVSAVSIQWWRDELESQVEEVIKLRKTQFGTSGRNSNDLSYDQRLEIRELIKAYLNDFENHELSALKENVSALEGLVKYQGHSIYKLKNNPAVREGALRKAILDKEGELGDLQEELEALKGFKAEGTE